MGEKFGVPRDPSYLIKALQYIQKEKGYISPKDALDVAEYLNVPLTKVYGVATFYEQFRLRPQGKYVIKVCHGTACHIKGGKVLIDFLRDLLGIDVGETTDDFLFTLERVACLGACALAPSVEINGKIYGNMTLDKLREIIIEIKEAEKNAKNHTSV
ncbi:MAG: NADH-quinone oxidoreductase subunit NuoE [Thermotogaceae bacterium]|nr:NADH-quinone oxidoreductase subunit NuoE [Thermotogaceae bacterium]